MNELVVYVLTEIRSALRFRWYGVAAAWLIALGGWGFVATLPDVYEASARVYVDTSSVLAPVLGDQIVARDVEAELAYVRESLLGTETLDTVARTVGLDTRVRDASERDALLRQLRNEIDIRTESNRGTRNSIYSILYRNTERDEAIAVVRTLLDVFVEHTIGARLTGSDTAGRFLAERIDEYEQRLQQAEQALADFKRANADRLPGTEGDYFTRLQTQREELAAAQQELHLLEARRQRLIEQLRGEAPVVSESSAAGQEPPPNSIDARIRDYEIRLDTMLLEYTERHPDVMGLRETLARLRTQRDQQLAALGVGSGREISALGANPVYQALQISLNDIEVEIASSQTDIAARERQVEQLQNLVDEVPEVEAELARLNRDYDVVYNQYVRLVQSRETQQLTTEASATDQIDFRIINPPSAPLDAVAPKRLVLLAGVFLAALGGGGGLCYLFSQLWPVFGSARALQEQLELPVLGTVAHAWQDRQRKERRRSVFAFSVPVVALVCVFAAVLAVETVGPGVNALYERVIQ